MPLTKVSAGVIAANAVVDSFGTQSITGDKLGLTAINANNIVGGAVTGDKLGATSINANNIVNASITGAKLAANTVSGDVIGQNAISSNNIVSVNASVATTGTLPSARLPSSSILQAITSTDSTERSTTSTSFVTASNTLSVTITPSSTSSKIFVVVTTTGYKNTDEFGQYTIYRNATNLGDNPNGMQTIPNSNYYPVAMSITDSPNTISAVTYQVYFRMTGGSGNAYLTAGPFGSDNFSSITVFEIKG